MDVLFVAPEIPGLPKLETWSEIDEIGDMVDVTLSTLTGPGVTRGRVTARLRQSYDVIIFAGHGRPGRFAVAGGHLTGRWMAQYVVGASPDVVLLSSCNSAGHGDRTLTSLAEEINRVGLTVIAMPTAVDDDGAAVYDVEFVRALANGADLRMAHDIALEQMETLSDSRRVPIFYAGRNVSVAHSESRMMERFDGLEGQIAEMVQRLDSVFAEQGRQAVRVGQMEEALGKLVNGGGASR